MTVPLSGGGAAAAVHVPGASARGWVIYPEEVEVMRCKRGARIKWITKSLTRTRLATYGLIN